MMAFARKSLRIVFFIILLGSIFFTAKCFFRQKRIGVEHIVKHFPFSEENSLKEWEEKLLKGKVLYLIETSDGELSYVRAKSEKSASALYYKIRLDVKRMPEISWKWRVDAFPKRDFPEKIEDIKEEDFAARVYVIFPAVFFTNSKVIEYIWSETLPEGTSGTSGYSKNIKVLTLRKGPNPEWTAERRDIYSDYIKLFGEKPKSDIGAIAFMTDADSTKTAADAVYDEIQVGYK